MGKHTHTKKRFIISTSLKLLFFFFYGQFLSCILGTSVEQLFLMGGISVSSELLLEDRLPAFSQAWHYWLRKKREYPRNAEHRSCTVAWVSQEALQAPRVAELCAWSHQIKRHFPHF